MNFFCRFCYQELHPKEIDENMLLQVPKTITCLHGSFTNFVNGNGQDITQS